MKKIIITVLFCTMAIQLAYADDFSDVIYNIRSGIDIFSDITRLQGEFNQSNSVQKQQNINTSNPLYQNNNTYNTMSKNESTSFTAKSKFADGNIFLRQEKYREAIDSYHEAKVLFESIGDIENAQKAEQAYESALEMRCEFGDYCY